MLLISSRFVYLIAALAGCIYRSLHFSLAFTVQLHGLQWAFGLARCCC